MEVIMSFFDFSVDKFKSPLVIIGIVLMVLAIMVVALAHRIDDMIYERRKAKSNAPLEDEAPSEDTGSVADNEEEKTDKVVFDYNSESESIFTREDGTLNWFTILKFIGLGLVIVSAILIILGLR